MAAMVEVPPRPDRSQGSPPVDTSRRLGLMAVLLALGAYAASWPAWDALANHYASVAGTGRPLPPWIWPLFWVGVLAGIAAIWLGWFTSKRRRSSLGELGAGLALFGALVTALLFISFAFVSALSQSM